MTGTEFRPRPTAPWGRLAVAVVAVLLVVPAAGFVAWLFWVAPVLHYTVDGATLEVVWGRPPFVRRRDVSLDRVRAARAVDGLSCRRTTGESMPGYCEGRFTCDGIGPVWMAGNCGGRDVVVSFEGDARPWVLSPGDPEAFLAAVREGGRYDESRPTLRRQGWGALLAAMPLLSLVTLVVPFLAIRGPARLAYIVGPEGIEVRTAMMRRRFPVVGATARAVSGNLGARLAGVGLPGYHTGWYWFAGGRARVYTARMRGCFVVVETAEGARVVLEPADPRAFLEALAAFGAVIDDSDPCTTGASA